jgi:mono/diheme cytochrome c family protein
VKERLSFAAILLFATVLFALAPLVRGNVEIPIAEHHLLHAAILAGAVLAGVLFASADQRARLGGAGWLLVALIAPVLAMLLMWPSEYAYFETHPYGHVLEHLGLVALGALTGYGGQRYARGVGWAAGMSAVAMGLLAAAGYGVGPATLAAAPAASAPAAAALSASPAGAELFKKNCSVCHGVAGAGGEGPPLRNERSRKTLAQLEAWIQNPAPPMPKLYPSVLSRQDVHDVASYVETLR